jgi:hypothetical protein
VSAKQSPKAASHGSGSAYIGVFILLHLRLLALTLCQCHNYRLLFVPSTIHHLSHFDPSSARRVIHSATYPSLATHYPYTTPSHPLVHPPLTHLDIIFNNTSSPQSHQDRLKPSRPISSSVSRSLEEVIAGHVGQYFASY